MPSDIKIDINQNKAGDLSRRLAQAPTRFSEAAAAGRGFQVDRLQRGLDPDDWKPMATVGPGVREIRVRDTSGAFRIVYVATFADAVHVLHAFQKKTQRTSPRDLELAKSRFKE